MGCFRQEYGSGLQCPPPGDFPSPGMGPASACMSFCPFVQFMRFSRQVPWAGLPFPPPVDHVWSELSAVTRPSWVVLHGMAHNFTELHKAVIHMIILVNFLWLWFSSWRLWDYSSSDDVITDLEPDILECEVKWDLGSITINKAGGGDRTPVELFQILRDDAVKVLHSICQQIQKTQQWPQDWKRSVFILIPKKGNVQECSNYCTIALISHASKVMLKILQARLQQYMNHELPDVQAGFRKGSGTRDQIVNIRWIIEKAREFQKNIYFCFIDYAEAFDCVNHNQLWKILKEMGIPDHLICLLRNLYAGQEATIRTGHGTTNWFQIGKGVRQGCILSPCLFNLYA